MKNTKVVHLGQVKDLLAEWDKVRQRIVAGSMGGFYTALCDAEGHEAIFWGGVYKEDSGAALKAMLKVAAVRALTEDKPPRFGTGR